MGKFILQEEVAYLLNQSASLVQSGLFGGLVFFFRCPALVRKEKVAGRVLAIIRSCEERWWKDGWFDSCRCVLSSLDVGVMNTVKGVPRQVLWLYLCKVLRSAVSEP